jgi:hypothetical protein
VDLQQVLLNGVDETVELQEGVTITYLDPNAQQAATQAQASPGRTRITINPQ